MSTIEKLSLEKAWSMQFKEGELRKKRGLSLFTSYLKRLVSLIKKNEKNERIRLVNEIFTSYLTYLDKKKDIAIDLCSLKLSDKPLSAKLIEKLKEIIKAKLQAGNETQLVLAAQALQSDNVDEARWLIDDLSKSLPKAPEHKKQVPCPGGYLNFLFTEDSYRSLLRSFNKDFHREGVIIQLKGRNYDTHNASEELLSAYKEAYFQTLCQKPNKVDSEILSQTQFSKQIKLEKKPDEKALRILLSRNCPDSQLSFGQKIKGKCSWSQEELKQLQGLSSSSKEELQSLLPLKLLQTMLVCNQINFAVAMGAGFEEGGSAADLFNIFNQDGLSSGKISERLFILDDDLESITIKLSRLIHDATESPPNIFGKNPRELFIPSLRQESQTITLTELIKTNNDNILSFFVKTWSLK